MQYLIKWKCKGYPDPKKESFSIGKNIGTGFRFL